MSVKSLLQDKQDLINNLGVHYIELSKKPDEDTCDESKFIMIDYYEDRKDQLQDLEQDMLQLKEIILILKSMLIKQDDDLELLETTLAHVKDEIAHTEMEIVVASTSLDRANSTSYWLYGVVVTSIALVCKYLLK